MHQRYQSPGSPEIFFEKSFNSWIQMAKSSTPASRILYCIYLGELNVSKSNILNILAHRGFTSDSKGRFYIRMILLKYVGMPALTKLTICANDFSLQRSLQLLTHCILSSQIQSRLKNLDHRLLFRLPQPGSHRSWCSTATILLWVNISVGIIFILSTCLQSY